MIELNDFIKLQETIPQLRQPLPPILVEAFRWYGTYEVDGPQDNLEIIRWARVMESYYRNSGGPSDAFRADQLAKYQHDSDEWCTLGASWTLFNQGWQIPKYPLWSQAYGNWFDPVQGPPQPGDLCVMWRPDPAKKLAARQLGHVFFVLGKNMDDFVDGIGANQSNGYNVKSIRVLPERLVGYRRPSEKWRRP